MASDSKVVGREFIKMSGSGNDFVFFDARSDPPGMLAEAQVVDRLCARGTGIGADGVVFILPPERGGDVRMRYLNRDGSIAALCGNATLCTARLSAELMAVDAKHPFRIETDSGVLEARVSENGPEIDMQPVDEIRAEAGIELADGELRIGFARAGVPHLVIPVEDLEGVAVTARGRGLRHHESLVDGANVNFVQRWTGGWAVRTYERGVEAETLACGTGAVASAILLNLWGMEGSEAELKTRSGLILKVRLRREGGRFMPSLSGEARIVFHGRLAEI
jgi:diaminopimelate epimerase